MNMRNVPVNSFLRNCPTTYASMRVSVYAASGSNNFVFRNTRQAIEAMRDTIAVGRKALYIWETDGRLIPTALRVITPTVILPLCW